MGSDDVSRAAKAAGLDRLTVEQRAEFERCAKVATELARKLPQDLHWTDEMALVLRLTPRAGGRS